jgi:hypothetical protein
MSGRNLEIYAILAKNPTVALPQRQGSLTWTLLGVLPPEGKHITTVTTPIGADIGDRLETMRDPMVDLLLVSLLISERMVDNKLQTFLSQESMLLTVSALDFEIHFVTTLG